MVSSEVCGIRIQVFHCLVCFCGQRWDADKLPRYRMLAWSSRFHVMFLSVSKQRKLEFIVCHSCNHHKFTFTTSINVLPLSASMPVKLSSPVIRDPFPHCSSFRDPQCVHFRAYSVEVILRSWYIPLIPSPSPRVCPWIKCRLVSTLHDLLLFISPESPMCNFKCNAQRCIPKSKIYLF